MSRAVLPVGAGYQDWQRQRISQPAARLAQVARFPFLVIASHLLTPQAWQQIDASAPAPV